MCFKSLGFELELKDFIGNSWGEVGGLNYEVLEAKAQY